MSNSSDISGMCISLLKHLDNSKYPEKIDPKALQQGRASEFISFIRFIFLGFSEHVRQSVVDSGYKFTTKNAETFMQTTNSALRHELGIYSQASVHMASDFACKLLILLLWAVS
jgi:hypothetical protein